LAPAAHFEAWLGNRRGDKPTMAADSLPTNTLTPERLAEVLYSLEN
jgi:hypothetical protein